MYSTFNCIRQFYKKYDRTIMALALLSGFVVDSITLKRIDLLFENIILFTHLSLAGITIVLMQLNEAGKLRGHVLKWFGLFAPTIFQYSLGGLFSAFFIFYFRSASIGTSWPFLLFLIVILIGNELFAKKLRRMTVQISIFFIALFSFSIFYIPVVFEGINTLLFIVSGIVSLVVITLFMLIIRAINEDVFIQERKRISTFIISIFLVLNLAYFTNIIPPIPLSLKNIQVAYETNRTSEGYRVVTAQRPWYKQILPRQHFQIEETKPIYIYSAVFAPTNLQTDILHQWEFKNSEGKWETRSEVQFPITGGRDGGYRGYTILWNTEEGKWRISIKTKTGQIIGRTYFTTEFVDEQPETAVTVY